MTGFSSLRRYILPAAAALYLLFFYLCLPEIDKVSPGPAGACTSAGRTKRITPKDFLLIFIITLCTAVISFFNLGSASSPETFALLGGSFAEIELEDDAEPCSFMLFSGVGTGEYLIDVSADGENFFRAASFMQNSGEVLKWNAVLPETVVKGKYIRISASGNAFLGEFAAFDASGQHLNIRSCSVPELADEQAFVQTEQNFFNSSYFDEIYHARTAWEHLNDVYPYEISHPPLGKLIIALGIKLFGMTPFGWRFSGTFFGVLLVPVIYVFSKKLFASSFVSSGAAIVYASDFMRFTQTRLATIDTYAVFFILLMYMFMYMYTDTEKLQYLALSGVFFGLGAASKWTCLYAGAGLAVIWAVFRFSRRKEGFRAFIENALFCVPFFIVIPCIIYCLSYIPYGRASGVQSIFCREYLDIVIRNQQSMFSYHSNLVAEHPYASVWYQWMFDVRPILYYLNYFPDGTRSSFGAWVNPVLCWGGLIALFVLIYRACFRKDNIAGFILIGYLAQLVPWMFVTRLTFEYHYFPCTAFLVLAVAYVFSLMENGSSRGKLCAGSFCVVSAAVFALFYPALSGMRVNSSLASSLLQWLPTWPF